MSLIYGSLSVKRLHEAKSVKCRGPSSRVELDMFYSGSGVLTYHSENKFTNLNLIFFDIHYLLEIKS